MFHMKIILYYAHAATPLVNWFQKHHTVAEYQTRPTYCVDQSRVWYTLYRQLPNIG